MNEIWQTVQPYILTIVGALGGGFIIYVIARILLGQLINKASSVYDVDAIAKKVADKLGGKTINVDITSIVEKRLKEISDVLSEKVKVVADETNSYKHLLALIGEALTHLKMLTDDERTELVKAIQELDGEYKPPEKEVIATVKLNPITLSETADAEPSPKNTVNFG
ncbi:MAG: hypothetical protein J1G01_04580 [Clostridiales bacterium]|nr:hypothetical protein [Clostridiales bacterium]